MYFMAAILASIFVTNCQCCWLKTMCTQRQNYSHVCGADASKNGLKSAGRAVGKFAMGTDMLIWWGTVNLKE